jgi:hypothetical protein
MPIELKESEKLVIPATTEVVLDKLWIKTIVIQTPSPLTEGSIVMEYGPWSGKSDEDAKWRDANGNDTTKTVRIDDLYASMQECPELYTVFQAILAAVKPMETYLEEKAARLAEESQP